MAGYENWVRDRIERGALRPVSLEDWEPIYGARREGESDEDYRARIVAELRKRSGSSAEYGELADEAIREMGLDPEDFRGAPTFTVDRYGPTWTAGPGGELLRDGEPSGVHASEIFGSVWDLMKNNPGFRETPEGDLEIVPDGPPLFTAERRYARGGHFKGKALDFDLFDPAENAKAMVRYMKERYGQVAHSWAGYVGENAEYPRQPDLATRIGHQASVVPLTDAQAQVLGRHALRHTPDYWRRAADHAREFTVRLGFKDNVSAPLREIAEKLREAGFKTTTEGENRGPNP